MCSFILLDRSALNNRAHKELDFQSKNHHIKRHNKISQRNTIAHNYFDKYKFKQNVLPVYDAHRFVNKNLYKLIC